MAPPDEEAFRFRHLLIRDAAYDSLPKETRAELHEAFAEWLDRHATLVEQDEIVGYHLERAYRSRSELDKADPRLDGLARRAALRLGGAARGAKERGDIGAFCGLLQRAAELLPEGDPERLEALVALGWPLNSVGRQDEALAGARELQASRDPRFQSYGHLAQTMVDLYSGRFDAERATSRVAAAGILFTELGDDLGLAWTGFLEFFIRWMSCHAAAAAEAALRGEARARAAGDDVLATWMRGLWGMALSFGPAPVGEAISAVKAKFAGATSILDRADAQRLLGKLLAMRGEIEQAREHAQVGIEGTREAGQLVEAAGYAMLDAFVEVRAGEPTAAEDALRRGVAELDRLGNASYRGTTALQLADALATRGEHEEAARWCAEVRESLNEDDLVDAISVDSLEGFLVAAAGSYAEGERLSGRAVRLAAPIDLYEAKGRAHEWHARTLALVGKPVEAREAAATALAIYEAKGDVPATAWARELLDSLSA